MEKFISIEEAKNIVMKQYTEAINKYSEVTGYNIEYPTIEWKPMGAKVAGKTFYKTGKICLNENYLYSQNYMEFLYETPLHELAHYLNYILYFSTGHNQSWKEICYELGLKGNRCHSFARPQNEESKKYARKYYEIKCDCMTHKVSSVKYNRIKNKTTQYYCVHCHKVLEI
jgi:SprT protein